MALLCLTPEAARACDLEQWNSDIATAADRFHITRDLVRAVIRVESAGCERIDGHPTTSAAGAMGLMQLMPSTWSLYQGRLNLGPDPYNSHDNILAGAAYLHDLVTHFGMLNGLAAYFAGPKNAGEVQSVATPLSRRTLTYVRDVLVALTADDKSAAMSTMTGLRKPTQLFALEHAKDGLPQVTPTIPHSTLLVIEHERGRDESRTKEAAEDAQ